jgi:hypothetical protein
MYLHTYRYVYTNNEILSCCVVQQFFNSASSLVRFDNKNVFFYLKNAIAFYNAGVVVVNSGANPTTFNFTATTPVL